MRRKVEIDCQNVESPEALQILIQYRLGYPDWYGRNLDAFYDMLTESTEPLNLVFITAENPPEKMGDYLKRLQRMLKDAEEENGALHVSFL